jgi:hypothetical protein
MVFGDLTLLHGKECFHERRLKHGLCHGQVPDMQDMSLYSVQSCSFRMEETAG